MKHKDAPNPFQVVSEPKRSLAGRLIGCGCLIIIAAFVIPIVVTALGIAASGAVEAAK